MENSDNVLSADNQQERFSIKSIPTGIGNFLSGFALGESSFMIVCRPRSDYRRKWKISLAFNVSQHDIVPLELFWRTLGCGGLRRAGNNGWYFEVNSLAQIRQRVIPFFERFPIIGSKANDFAAFKTAADILAQTAITDADYTKVLSLRESMNNGGKRKYLKEKILRDYTPKSDT